MFELIRAGGWVMWPLILCSIAALAIIGERFWSLQKKYGAPESLLPQVRQWLARDELDGARLELLRESSLLGRILSAGLVNREHDRDIIKEAIEDAGRHSVPELERYLRTLGTIAAISPFLGLLGTVLGMIEMFMGIGSKGVGDPSIVASGIAQALIATASGLTVAIPSLIFYRYFRGRVNDLLVDMEQTALKLVEILQGERESD
jgi:biopolymer transport protein ExbB